MGRREQRLRIPTDGLRLYPFLRRFAKVEEWFFLARYQGRSDVTEVRISLQKAALRIKTFEASAGQVQTLNSAGLFYCASTGFARAILDRARWRYIIVTAIVGRPALGVSATTWVLVRVAPTIEYVEDRRFRKHCKSVSIYGTDPSRGAARSPNDAVVSKGCWEKRTDFQRARGRFLQHKRLLRV